MRNLNWSENSHPPLQVMILGQKTLKKSCSSTELCPPELWAGGTTCPNLLHTGHVRAQRPKDPQQCITLYTTMYHRYICSILGIQHISLVRIHVASHPTPA